MAEVADTLVPLSAVLALLLRREEARGQRLRQGPPVREGPDVPLPPQPAPELAASDAATDAIQERTVIVRRPDLP